MGQRHSDIAVDYPVVTREVDIGGRTWSVTAVENQDQLLEGVQTDHDVDYFPYGILLWASAIGLAAHLDENPALVRGRRTLEIGCGVGLAGLVAAALGGIVTQTDYLVDAIMLSGHNAARNGIGGIDLIQADWRDFPDLEPFEVVLGSDVLYERAMHSVLGPLLRRIVAPGGQLILSDPLRPQALDFVQAMESSGWNVEIESWLLEWDGDRREIALFTATRTMV
jgi:predicted nicotinamide N-methyase